MILQAKNYRFEIRKKRDITYETFTKRYALANLEKTLIRACQDLEQLPANKRRRQREKISRLEARIDALRLEIKSER